MKNQLSVIAEVEGLGKIVQANADLYTELKQLREAGARLISPRDEAYARLQTRKKENIGKNYGTRTSAGFEYIKKENPIFRLSSRLNNQGLAKLAVEANRQENYFHTNSTKEYEDSLKQAEKDKDKDPTKRNVIILPLRTNFTMSDKENWEIYQAILKDQARPYFELNGPITIYPVSFKKVDSQDGTILTNLWFLSLDVGSDFVGDDWNLNDGDGAARGSC